VQPVGKRAAVDQIAADLLVPFRIPRLCPATGGSHGSKQLLLGSLVGIDQPQHGLELEAGRSGFAGQPRAKRAAALPGDRVDGLLGLDNREDAERVFDLAGDLAKQELLQLEDAAYAWRDDKGKVRIQQAVSLTAAGAASGALWGTLIGLIFLMPVAGLAIGAASGALGGKLADVGINDDTIKRIGAQLQGGRAAVFLLARSATVDRVIDAIKPYNPTVIQTNLTKDREEELVQALQS
jgi:uncharacterized membrane protein